MAWTKFWDMNSGGGRKEPYTYIYIEAERSEAASVFYSRFGHNPERVTCTCCGEDYAISEEPSLKEASAYHRNCRTIETKRDPQTNLYLNDDAVIAARGGWHLEQGEEPPEGYEVSKFGAYGEYQTIEQHEAREEVLVIRANDITDQEKAGEVPTEGYIYVGPGE